MPEGDKPGNVWWEKRVPFLLALWQADRQE